MRQRWIASSVEDCGHTVLSRRARKVQRSGSMEKIFAVALASLTAAGLVFACSSSDDSTFDNKNPTPDADTTETGSFNTGDGGDGSAPKDCNPAIPASFMPQWNPPNKTAACTTAEIDGTGSYYEACLADPTKTADCQAWLAAHAACAACIEPANGSGPVQWHDTTRVKRNYVTFNVAGCIAIKSNALGPNDCGAAYNAAVECGRQSCDKCFATGGSQDDFVACEQAVSTQGICKSYQTQQSQTCAGIKDAGAPSLDCFKGSGETSEAFFTRLITIFCGP